MQWLRRLLQESLVRQQIIWLDCCHSGELINFDEAQKQVKTITDNNPEILEIEIFEQAIETTPS